MTPMTIYMTPITIQMTLITICMTLITISYRPETLLHSDLNDRKKIINLVSPTALMNDPNKCMYLLSELL